MTTTPDQPFVILVERPSIYSSTPKAKAYEVFVDGVEVGTVEQRMTRHDRKPKGSRIVTRRTYSLRWYGRALATNRHSFDRVTRWEAIADVLAGANPGTISYDWGKAARTATVAKTAPDQEG